MTDMCVRSRSPRSVCVAVACVAVHLIAASAEPAPFSGVDKAFVDHAVARVKNHPKLYHYVCRNGYRQTVVRTTRQALKSPDGRRRKLPVKDKPIGKFGGRPTDRAIAHVKAVFAKHNSDLAKSLLRPAVESNNKPGAKPPTPSQPKPGNAAPAKPAKVSIKPIAVLNRRPLLTDREWQVMGRTEFVRSIAFSKDGTHLVAWTGQTVVAWDIKQGKPVYESRRLNAGPRLVAPQANLFAFVKTTKPRPLQPNGLPGQAVVPTIEAHDFRHGRARSPLRVSKEGFGRQMSRSLSPTGRWFAAVTTEISASGYRELVVVSDVTTGKVRFKVSPDGKPTGPTAGRRGATRIWATAFSNDSRYLAAALSDGSLVVWNVATGRPYATFAGKRAYSEFDGHRRLVWLGQHDAVLMPSFEPGGYLRCDMKTRKATPLQNNGTRGVPRTRSSESEPFAEAVSQDGKWLIHTKRLTSVRPIDKPMIFLDDLTTGQLLGHCYPMPNDRVAAMAFSPDGEQLAIGTINGDIFVYRTTDTHRLVKAKGTLAGTE